MPRVLQTSFLVFSAGLAAEVTLDCTQLGRFECLTSAQSHSHQFRSSFGGAGFREARISVSLRLAESAGMIALWGAVARQDHSYVRSWIAAELSSL